MTLISRLTIWSLLVLVVLGVKFEYPNEQNYPCKVPTPLVFNSRSLLEDYGDGWVNGLVQPFQVALHRCEGAGFCRDDDCVMATGKNVSFVFKIITTRNGKPTTKQITVMNHTSCACPKKLFNEHVAR